MTTETIDTEPIAAAISSLTVPCRHLLGTAIMRCQKFNPALLKALRTLNAHVDADRETAVINGARVEITRPAHSTDLLLVITARNGVCLTCHVKGKRIVKDTLSNDEEEDVQRRGRRRENRGLRKHR